MQKSMIRARINERKIDNWGNNRLRFVNLKKKNKIDKSLPKLIKKINEITNYQYQEWKKEYQYSF